MDDPVGKIAIEIELPLSDRRVWALFTGKESLCSWLAVDARIGIGVGAPFELFWDPRNPEINSTIGCVITEWQEPRRFAIQWKGPAEFASIMNAEPVPTWVSVDLERFEDDRTLVRLEHGGWRSGPEWERARAWHAAVWQDALDRLRSQVQDAH